jgi:hypothetical protein
MGGTYPGVCLVCCQLGDDVSIQEADLNVEQQSVEGDSYFSYELPHLLGVVGFCN